MLEKKEVTEAEMLAGGVVTIPDTKMLEKVLERPCPSCGSKLKYSAEKQRICCDYCGYAEDFDKANDRVQELELNDAISKAPKLSTEQQHKKVYNCSGCGSKVMIGSTDVYVQCSFCGSKNINEEAYEHNIIQPAGIIPFKIPKIKATEQFEKWIKKGFFTPSKLKIEATIDALKGVYLPFWTYDANTHVQFSGSAGFHYNTSQQQIVNGKVTTSKVQKTKWEYRNGQFDKSFDDVLVIASQGIPQDKATLIYPYNMKEVVNFDPQLMLGWEAEIYNIDVKKGYETAEKQMDEQIRAQSMSLIGGDTQREVRVMSQKFNQTFKHIILPIWICSYIFNGKTFNFLINGQTGKIYGKKPKSPIKIALTVLSVIVLFVLLYFLATRP